MNPFFFGRSERPLFGLYTEGRAGGGGGRAVLLCYPMGSEYMRAHRAFRQLNNLLNRDGFHVLRFDYSCTGDSAGPGSEASVDEWLDDVDWAIDELMDNAGVETLDVVGLRWGATLAALATRSRDEVGHQVLWDPIVSGAAYLEQLLGPQRPEGLVGIEGYPVSQSLRDQIAAIDLRSDLGTTGPPRSSVLTAQDLPEYHELGGALNARGDNTRLQVVPSPGSWAEADPFGDALIPQDIIRAIVDRLQTTDDRE